MSLYLQISIHFASWAPFTEYGPPSSRGFFSTVLPLGETIICPDLNLAELVAFSPTHSFRIDGLSIYLACH